MLFWSYVESLIGTFDFFNILIWPYCLGGLFSLTGFSSLFYASGYGFLTKRLGTDGVDWGIRFWSYWFWGTLDWEGKGIADYSFLGWKMFVGRWSSVLPGYCLGPLPKSLAPDVDDPGCWEKIFEGDIGLDELKIFCPSFL